MSKMDASRKYNTPLFSGAWLPKGHAVALPAEEASKDGTSEAEVKKETADKPTLGPFDGELF